MNLYLSYFFAFGSAFLLAVVFTLIIKKTATKYNVLDYPDGMNKIHQSPTPLLGGLAIFAAFFAVVFYFTYFTDLLIAGGMKTAYIWVFFIASAVIMFGGVLDDKFSLKPSRQVIFPLIAVFILIIGGVGITKITNPAGGFFYLDQYEWVIMWWSDMPYKFTLWADLFTVIWVMGMMYTTKLLDGLDGLVTGVGTIGAVIIFLLSTSTQWWQPETAVLAAVFVGATLGFLIFNFHPAKIFLGEGGALFVGFILGVLSIISGGKVATALLIMSIPILDVVWIIVRRLFWEKKDPFRNSDRKHLHFRLLDIGFSHRAVVIILYLFSVVFGSLTLFLQSKNKIVALIIIAVLMIVMAFIIVYWDRKKYNISST